ncbi:hypothetical protein ACQJBY_061582 [Aegilops geniculata]
MPSNPFLRCSGSNLRHSSGGDGPRPSPSSYPGSLLRLKSPASSGDRDDDGSAVVFYHLRSRLAPSSPLFNLYIFVQFMPSPSLMNLNVQILECEHHFLLSDHFHRRQSPLST